jgi:hypothetical protein
MTGSDSRGDSTALGQSIIDEATGAFLADAGNGLRLHLQQMQFGPDELVPESCTGGDGVRARRFVIDHMIRRFGSDTRDWPYAARSFIRG